MARLASSDMSHDRIWRKVRRSSCSCRTNASLSDAGAVGGGPGSSRLLGSRVVMAALPVEPAPRTPLSAAAALRLVSRLAGRAGLVLSSAALPEVKSHQ